MVVGEPANSSSNLGQFFERRDELALAFSHRCEILHVLARPQVVASRTGHHVARVTVKHVAAAGASPGGLVADAPRGARDGQSRATPLRTRGDVPGGFLEPRHAAVAVLQDKTNNWVLPVDWRVVDRLRSKVCTC